MSVKVFSQMHLLVHKAFQRASLSTESKADLILTNGGVSDSVSYSVSVTDVLENYGNHSRFRVVERRTSSRMVKMVAADKGAVDKQCLGEGKLLFQIQRRAASAPSYLALEWMMLTFNTVNRGGFTGGGRPPPPRRCPLRKNVTKI